MSKSWVLFTITVVIPFIIFTLQVFNTPNIGENIWKLMIVPCLSAIIYWTWIWSSIVSIGKSVGASLASGRKVNFAIIYNYLFTVSLPFYYYWFSNINNNISESVHFAFLVISLLCTVYAITYLSISISKCWQKGKVSISESILNFLSILYFPIGVWYVQPKIRLISIEHR